MYIVQWCDHEGILHERRFSRLQDAQQEAEALRKTYDWVKVIQKKNARNGQKGVPNEF